MNNKVGKIMSIFTLSGTIYRILLLLEKEGKMRPKDLGIIIGFKENHVFIKSAFNFGWIEKFDSNNREVYYSITESGKNILKDVDSIVEHADILRKSEMGLDEQYKIRVDNILICRQFVDNL